MVNDNFIRVSKKVKDKLKDLKCRFETNEKKEIPYKEVTRRLTRLPEVYPIVNKWLDFDSKKKSRGYKL